MATPPFVYQDPFPLGPDTTGYRLLSREGISTATFEGREILKVAPEALAYLTRQAFHDTSFFLRTDHLRQVAAILDDPEASANDRYVALTLVRLVRRVFGVRDGGCLGRRLRERGPRASPEQECESDVGACTHQASDLNEGRDHSDFDSRRIQKPTPHYPRPIRSRASATVDAPTNSMPGRRSKRSKLRAGTTARVNPS